ncbi:YHS domain protein [Falsiroseomonas bella]|uniref:YHS domain protein n=1 Tax=Falsiroseomonas bella TaxID=2184016 RepID=A0A317F8R9_9PROT|nr:YHS domain-containing (seleno)protein [Falsiroseomonas bella]PWS35541.1 YHS domain protein [Falsiroseomonas bella]
MQSPAIRLDRRSLAALFIGLAVAPQAARAAKPEINAEDGLALRGYDAVAYFTQARPVRGEARFEAEWGGARWRFADAANRDAFLADPARYAPQFGGYCAWAVAQGYTAPADPLQWRIVEGKLYVNYDAGVQRRWLRDIPGFITAADRNWPAVLTR